MKLPMELHLKADKNLDEQTALALARMFKAAYDEAECALQAEQKIRKGQTFIGTGLL